MQLESKTFIVTGGANGIGKCLVEQLLERGAKVGVIDTNECALAELNETSPEVFCAEADVSDINAVKTAVDSMIERFGSIDGLVNNAAVVYSAPLVSLGPSGLVSHDVNDWRKVVDTNLNGVFYVSSPIAHHMVSKRTKGIILNVSSVSASGNAGQSAYSATKAGIEALTITWSKELSALGIRVAGIAPGFTATETTLGSMPEKSLNDWKSKTPLRRFATSEEIVKGILFIIDNDYFNGRVLQVDGGLRI